ncbi:XRE family transcriptional regulator [Glaciihabitans sp. UYNi722]|uniref:helix-turn-helix domain-containing protein n=1 Tax=Glaciihabitans sp. UYNi722 TaxID=3156344 RepID=UPI00339774EA
MDEASIATTVGRRLRSIRRKQDQTIAELSQRTGISSSTISRLERGDRQPNLELLLPLARALGVGLDGLVPGAVPDPRITRAARRIGRVSVMPLSTESASNQTFRMSVPWSARKPELRIHEGYDWVYVLSGRLRILLGDQEFILGAGEAAEFDTRTPHWMGSAERGTVETLTIFDRGGEWTHLHPNE